MNIQEQIDEYIFSLPELKRNDMQELHRLMLRILPEGKLWFDSGKNDEDKTISNPTIGYGLYTIHYANGKSREFFQIGLSGNTTGISVYILGVNDKMYLAQTYGQKIGKAKVTGYCIKFKVLKDIHKDVLEKAIRYGIEASHSEFNS